MPLTVLLTALAIAPRATLSQTPDQAQAQDQASDHTLPPADLPPDRPQLAFAAEYRIEINVGGRFAWGRRRLFLSGALLRDELLDGDVDRATLIADRDSNLLLRFDPDDAAKIAKRLAWNDGRALPFMAQGYGIVAQRLGPPRLIGQREIVGQSCTRLVWEAVGERQEWCITPEGLVLAARRNAGVNETKIEALLVEFAQPDAGLFALPAGFVAQE
ncbi:MAG: hypothetical protein ABI439_10545 [Rhodospirillales bacterium]